MKILTLWRKTDAELHDVPVNVERDAICRVDIAYKNFFRRVKKGTTKFGYPRFKPSSRYNSITISQPGKVIYADRVHVTGIDMPIRCRNLRPADGKIKQLRILRRAGRWLAQLVIESPDVHVEPRTITNAVGFDMGLKSFVAGSDGFSVPAPQFYRKLEAKLKRANRNVSRKKKGSVNRRKAVRRLQRVHLAIADARYNFTHHLSKQVVASYDLIAIEALNVNGMVRGRFGKSILDAAWSQFTWQLRYKAESAGVHVVEVDPRGTTQECSQCGETVPKDLSVRVHDCPHCGLTLDRDINAARNILRRALGELPAVGREVTPVERLPSLVEAGR